MLFLLFSTIAFSSIFSTPPTVCFSNVLPRNRVVNCFHITTSSSNSITPHSISDKTYHHKTVENQSIINSNPSNPNLNRFKSLQSQFLFFFLSTPRRFESNFSQDLYQKKKFTVHSDPEVTKNPFICAAAVKKRPVKEIR
jgi:hypothetical protein